MANHARLIDDLPDRIRVKIAEQPSGCWLWLGCLTTGYGIVYWPSGSRLAHRVVYELLVGPIPRGLQIDHLCRTRACVNPAHTEPVTQQENIRRGDGGCKQRAKTQCPQGHAYDETNTKWFRGHRYCRACADHYYRTVQVPRRELARIARRGTAE